jgi:hypothetical protein
LDSGLAEVKHDAAAMAIGRRIEAVHAGPRVKRMREEYLCDDAPDGFNLDAAWRMDGTSGDVRARHRLGRGLADLRREELRFKAATEIIVLVLALFIVRADFRDTQATQAKLDKLLEGQGQASEENTSLDEREIEEIVEHRQTAKAPRIEA